MPIVDTNAPLATNSDAAMWRQDHDAAIRYIEALLAERETWAPVMEAAQRYGAAHHAFLATVDRVGRYHAACARDYAGTNLLDAAKAIAAALQEGNADG